MSDYLQDAALIAIALDLPMFDHRLLSAERGRAPNPKDTCTKQILRCGVVEYQPRIWRKSSHVKRILHEQEDVNVIRLRLCRNERAENDEAREMAGRACQVVDPFKASRHERPARSRPEMLEDRPHGGSV